MVRGKTWLIRGLVSVLAGALAVLVAPALAMAAAPVRIDPGFGAGGIARTPLPPSYQVEGFDSVAAGVNGGVTVSGSDETFAYDAHGAPIGGEKSVMLGSVRSEAATADGGRVVIAPSTGAIGWGIEDPDGRISRFNADGSPSTSFGEGGTVSGLPLIPEALVALPSGKVLVAGEGVRTPGGVKTPPTTQVTVVRLDADGSLDPSFGSGGTVGLGAAFGVPGQGTLFLQAHGGEGAEVATRTAIVALDPSGKPDAGFGKGGKVTTLGQVVGAEVVGEDVLVAGTKRLGATPTGEPSNLGEAPSREELYVVRYGPNGKPDLGFGGDGVGVLSPKGEVRARSVLFGADGSTLIGGSVTPPPRGCPLYYFCDNVPVIARFTPAGLPDTGFAQGGLLRLSSLAARTGGESLRGTLALAARPGGGAFAAGESAQASFVAAIGADGTLDGSFGEGGIVKRVETEPANSSPAAVGVDRRGRIYVAADTTSGAFGNAAVVRYLPGGELDRSYGESGEAFVAAGPRALAVAPDGSAFTVTHETGPLPTLTKVMPNGRLDPHFADGGTAFFPFGPGRYEPASVVRLADGDLIVTGNLSVGNSERPALVRFLPSGKLDPRFGSQGVDELRLGRQRRWFARTVIADPRGRLLLSGLAELHPRQRDATDEAALVRLDRNGAIDRSFGHRGSVLFGPGDLSVAGEMALVGGRIVTLAHTRVGRSEADRLYAFSADGRPDRGFGRDGAITASLPPHGRSRSEPGEIGVGMFRSGNRILVLRSRSILSFSAAGHLESARSRRLPGLLPRWQTKDVSLWGPAAALDGKNLVVAWAGTALESEGKYTPSEVNLRRVLGE
jgi:uncharacterized delta-60 repeat protein